MTPQNRVVTVIAPPVKTLFVATFPDDMVYVGIEAWTYKGTDWYCPGVYRLPPDISNPQFSFPYIGDSNMWDQASNQRVFTPEYDVNAVLAGHFNGNIWST